MDEGLTNREKYPDIWPIYEVLLKEEAEIQAKTAPLRQERDELQQQIAPFMDQVRALTEQINVIERPRLVEVQQQKAALARAMGGRVMSQGG